MLCYSILLDMLFTCYGSSMALISCFAMPVIIRNYFELNLPLWVWVARVWVRVRWWVQKRVSVPIPRVPLPVYPPGISVPVSNTSCRVYEKTRIRKYVVTRALCGLSRIDEMRRRLVNGLECSTPDGNRIRSITTVQW